MRFPFDLIVFDLETSGSRDHRVVEIGAVRLDTDLRVTDRFSSLVDGRPMVEEATRINRITDAMLEGQPTFAEIHGKFDEWCAQSQYYLLAAFGAYFDMPVLRAEYDRLGMKFPHRGEAIDIKAVVWWEVVKRGLPAKGLKLDRALDLLGIKFDGTRHRALPDAWNEARILIKLSGRAV